MRISPALRWAFVGAWCGTIFYLSSRSSVGPDVGIPNFDKVEHLVAYGTGGFLFAAALRATRPGTGPALAILAAGLFCLLYGASDEFHQSFVPDRESSLLDLVADTAGGLLGGAAALALRRSRREARGSNLEAKG